MLQRASSCCTRNLFWHSQFRAMCPLVALSCARLSVEDTNTHDDLRSMQIAPESVIFACVARKKSGCAAGICGAKGAERHVFTVSFTWLSCLQEALIVHERDVCTGERGQDRVGRDWVELCGDLRKRDSCEAEGKCRKEAFEKSIRDPVIRRALPPDSRFGTRRSAHCSRGAGTCTDVDRAWLGRGEREVEKQRGWSRGDKRYVLAA